MSAQPPRIVSFISIALLVGLLPAQEKAKTADELRKENAALREQVKTLRAKLDAKKVPSTGEKVEDELPWGVGVKNAVGLRLNVALAKRTLKGLDLVLKPGTEVTFVRLADLEAKTRTGECDYRKSVQKLGRATQSLNAINDPTKARKVVDEIERILLDVRRELWKVEQAAKKKEKDPIKKSNKRSDSAVVSVDVPVQAVPIRLNLNWPILSEATDSKDELFFSFRRF
jgi:ElaB/YqjD/DUF883 family membrane-anchored ribosome-binding protein